MMTTKEYFETAFIESIGKAMIDQVTIEENHQTFWIEKDNWYIECEIEIEADWRYDGDGYWEPREIYCAAASGSIRKLILAHCDENEEELEVSEAEYREMEDYLQGVLDAICEI